MCVFAELIYKEVVGYESPERHARTRAVAANSIQNHSSAVNHNPGTALVTRIIRDLRGSEWLRSCRITSCFLSGVRGKLIPGIIFCCLGLLCCIIAVPSSPCTPNFSNSGKKIWNSLPSALRPPGPSFAVFKQHFKSYLFNAIWEWGA